MTDILEGEHDGRGMRLALVVARYNEAVTGRLLDGAERCLARHEVPEDGRLVARVPGASPLNRWSMLRTVGLYEKVCRPLGGIEPSRRRSPVSGTMNTVTVAGGTRSL